VIINGDMESAEFKAFIGLLTGDPASPILWNLFLADLVMMPDRNDVFLAAVRISLLAQADDILLFSLSARGLQAKLNTLERWCSRNFILINMIKTIIPINGKVPLPLHTGQEPVDSQASRRPLGYKTERVGTATN
jgi:hypothetical protein